VPTHLCLHPDLELLAFIEVSGFAARVRIRGRGHRMGPTALPRLERREQGNDGRGRRRERMGRGKALVAPGGEGKRPALGRAPMAGRCGGRERCYRRRG
jgi:hypothetical protein